MITVTPSLRLRLALWLMAGATALGVMLLVDARITAHRNAERAYDAQLTAAALTLADAIRWAGTSPVVTVPAATLRILSGRSQERVYYGVFDASGHRLTGNLALPVPAGWRARAAEHPVFKDTVWDDASWRLHGQRFDLAGWSRHTALQIWVGQTTQARHALAARLFEPAVMRFLILIVAAGVLGLVAIASTLAPVRRLRDHLAARRADDFTPLDTRVPGELVPLAQTLDHLFARQRSAHDTLLRFTADASHQLKTPLAGLANASEAALESTDPAIWRATLHRLHDTATGSARLAGQLLQRARVSHEHRLAEEVVDLSGLVAAVAREHADSPTGRRRDLALIDSATPPARVLGAAWALREALTNLLDNALRYTPPDTPLTVRLADADAACLFLAVEDRGPGIDADEADALRAPFRRGRGMHTPGSGLGLSIVDSIARAHGGTFTLTRADGGGCRAVLMLPRATENDHASA